MSISPFVNRFFFQKKSNLKPSSIMILPFEFIWAGRPLFIDLRDIEHAAKHGDGRAILRVGFSEDGIVVDNAYEEVRKVLMQITNRFIEVTVTGQKIVLQARRVEMLTVNELGLTEIALYDGTTYVLDERYKVVKKMLSAKGKSLLVQLN
jgi:hypothetical protein